VRRSALRTDFPAMLAAVARRTTYMDASRVANGFLKF
jgi:hypothetical protein